MEYLRRVNDEFGEQGSGGVWMVAAAFNDVRMVSGRGNVRMELLAELLIGVSRSANSLKELYVWSFS
uniref:Uncharacterized protein n=1 Tax=Cucumis melo TaxID=3656 RepID=A0A9I9DUX9_CUCME